MVVHSGSRFLGERSKTEALYILPPTGRKEPYTKEELLTETADTTIDDDQFKSYTNKLIQIPRYSSLLEKRMDDKVDVNGRIKQAKGQFQAMREIMTVSGNNAKMMGKRYYVEVIAT